PVLTVHSARRRGFGHFMHVLAVRSAQSVIYVSSEIASRFGCRGAVAPAFLPPTDVELGETPKCWPIVERLRASGRRLIVSNASRPAIHDGVDLYGLDLLFDAFHRPDI